jgi:hypothetical protein
LLKIGRWRLTIPAPIGPDGGMGPEYRTGDPDDDEVLRQIAAVSPLSSPRHWIHFLPCRDEAAARAAAAYLAGEHLAGAELAGAELAGAELTSAAWTVSVTHRRRRDWCVTAEQADVVISAPAVREARTLFEAVAARIPGVSYDGWHASV